MDMKAINKQVIAEYRAGEPLSLPGMHRERLALLTTTGSKTGKRSTAPMLFVPSGDGILVIASNDGAPTPPHWYGNLLADPAVHIELPDREYDGIAHDLEGAERDEVWAQLVVDYPFLADQQERAPRTLPVVRIVEA
jgi:deazaflavin-dependent oxidoreductase (nitroreductase family)